MEILRSLNLQQQQAVLHNDGPLLVLAGAGSGKTRVLTHRIAHFIHNGVDPRNILAVTFTNKAAKEMKDRVDRLLGGAGIDGVLWIGTFHGICVRILKKEISRLGYKERFSIYDEYDQQSLVKDCLKAFKFDEKKYNPGSIVSRISRAKDDLIDEIRYKEYIGSHYEGQVAKVYQLYQARLREANAVDFGDLIMLAVRILSGFKSVLKEYQERFKYLLIDEYQDTNHAQYELIKLLAGVYRNVFAVGDPDQSIYGWRGADINNILNFEKDFRNASVIKLEQNYRSTKTILAAANSVIENNARRKKKSLWTDNPDGQKITCYQAEDGEGEAGYIAMKINEFKGSGRRLNDMVVFYRLHAQSRLIEDALRTRGIPYVIVGGVRFYDRREIKDVLAYLKVIDNTKDIVSLKRIVNVPRRGIGSISLKAIQAHAIKHNIPLFDAMKSGKDIPHISPRAAEVVKKFTDIILRNQKDRPVSRIIKGVVEGIGYLRGLLSEGSEESLERADNVKELISAAVQFEMTNPGAGLHEFLEEVALVSDVDRWDDKSGAVTLMTLHAAKGLEFPICFMAGLEESIFPHFGKASADGEDQNELEEERRLCYVGMTRAKESLFFTLVRRRMIYGRWSEAAPSRFLWEIEEKYLENDGY